jgi:hypothetical protein
MHGLYGVQQTGSEETQVHGLTSFPPIGGRRIAMTKQESFGGFSKVVKTNFNK